MIKGGEERRCDPDDPRRFGWTHAVTATDGTWRASGLPRRPLRLLATRGATPLDAFAVTIDYPWAAVTSLTIAD
ncbi:MAG TPA: hypothetical protein VGF48_17410 [Thermoanaerobaculia bacterium]